MRFIRSISSHCDMRASSGQDITIVRVSRYITCGTASRRKIPIVVCQSDQRKLNPKTVTRYGSASLSPEVIASINIATASTSGPTKGMSVIAW